MDSPAILLMRERDREARKKEEEEVQRAECSSNAETRRVKAHGVTGTPESPL